MDRVERPTFEARLRAIHYALSALVLGTLTVAAALLSDGGPLPTVLATACLVAFVGSFLTVTRARVESNDE